MSAISKIKPKSKSKPEIEPLFDGTLEQAHFFKGIFSALENVFDTANLDISSEGFSMEDIDGSHVLSAIWKLNMDAFSSYQFDENKTIGISIPSMIKMLKFSNNSDMLHLTVNDIDNLDMISESEGSGIKTGFNLKLLNIESNHYDTSGRVYSCLVSMPANEFKTICDKLENIGGDVILKVTKEELKIVCKGDFGNVEILIPVSQELKMSEPRFENDKALIQTSSSSSRDGDQDNDQDNDQDDNDKIKIKREVKDNDDKDKDKDDKDKDDDNDDKDKDKDRDSDKDDNDDLIKIKREKMDENDDKSDKKKIKTETIEPGTKKRKRYQDDEYEEKMAKYQKSIANVKIKSNPKLKPKIKQKITKVKSKSSKRQDLMKIPIRIECKEETTLQFGLSYIKKICKCSTISPIVTFRMHAQLPLNVHFDFYNESNEHIGYMEFFLCARIPDDELL